ncbi:serine hydrolase [Brasilonema sp. UFV-L1]|uniref:serine hydrolase n=1 Tax=Brasilonema sp. UFV-L1 TaxID=2234130 RepID=UPI00145C8409|nr:serine hydrolase [Brasilonema sp. UFV-L1]NMG11451.1 serine hydrolase [Brasilonema sp. UFV-L1]
MATRTVIKTVSRRQSTSRRPVKSKVQKQGQNKKVGVAKQQQASDSQTMPTPIKSIPPLTPVTLPTKRTGTAATAIKPTATAKGKIPPYNPKTVQSKNVQMRKQPLPRKASSSRRKTQLKPMAKTLLYAVRLLIVGVGLGAIVGTALSVLDPATRITTSGGTSSDTTIRQAQPQFTQNPSEPASGLLLTQEISSLKAVVQNLAAANPTLTPGVFLVDLDNGSYVDVNGSSSFSAASTIKIPILIAFFQDVDAGKIRLDETLIMTKKMVVGGSGDMQYKPVGTEFTAVEVATKMMTVSDNTATNMLITRLGGIEVLNQRFRSWGLTTTAIRNPLPDLEGTNTTSPKELTTLMAMLSKGNLVSLSSRDRMLDIMRRTVRNHLLPTGLGVGATIAHKTGDIGTTLADAGLVDMPTGKRYIVAVMVQRPNNDPRAEKLISSISRAAYQLFSPTAPIPPSTGSTAPTTGYQSPVMTPPLPNNMGSPTMPTTGYQSPAFNPLPSNGMGNPIPPNVYQPPIQPPVMNPQYYYPYQR